MDGAGILIIGVLALAAVLAITAAIVAMAPYLAIVIVLGGLCWLALKGKDDPPPPDEPPQDGPKIPAKLVPRS